MTTPEISTLANGVRVLTLQQPHLQTASASVYLRCGSAYESKAENGISHFVEHVVFKGSRTRDARRINLDAERLGAEVNAHTDKDHTAFHMRGLARHGADFVAMLGDIVTGATFPPDEIERERQVLLHECTEDEDDPMSTAFKLFDRACFGEHGAAQSVIGPRRNIERFTREQLAGWVQGRYTGANCVVGVAGNVRHQDIVRAAEAAFAPLPPGEANTVAPAPYLGGIATQRDPGSSQAHVVVGWPIPPMPADDAACVMAAAVLGEGMSSPLLDQVRERRGLAYYAHCSADVLAMCGQFVIEASTGPDQVDELLQAVLELVHAHAGHVDPLDLERAQHQLLVRKLREHERPHRLLEDAALDLLMLGRVRAPAEWQQRLQAVTADEVRAAFARLWAAGPTVALAGELPRAASQRVKKILQASGIIASAR
jgi:predicted Zn-dependent peptidase